MNGRYKIKWLKARQSARKILDGAWDLAQNFGLEWDSKDPAQNKPTSQTSAAVVLLPPATS